MKEQLAVTHSVLMKMVDTSAHVMMGIFSHEITVHAKVYTAKNLTCLIKVDDSSTLFHA